MAQNFLDNIVRRADDGLTQVDQVVQLFRKMYINGFHTVAVPQNIKTVTPDRISSACDGQCLTLSFRN
ncbi:uncharacterized protein METZ01_LOCUS225755, partial [marine metagenome]